eukprot:CAMPEP_0170768148 /NCGR_PEP_ID=MMETSP0733-20121128/6197_1 /TAXON_ID=186038 /ORGANISM="Fragilariopsis kerguelensis, Strain L26-C5" /LENGTH=254 /DNA_ID=CAMNT_0011109473 /DNA_START=174 /DNA_END=934 /DNA_ORIENTATION=+
MTEEETSTVEQIVEYESQLISIVQLLEASPDDESLLVLKKDMEELLELSRATIESESSTPKKSVGTISDDLPLLPQPSPPQPVESNTQLKASDNIYRHPNVKQETATETVPPIDTAKTFNDDGSSGGGDEIVASMKKAPPQKVKKRKKHKKVKEFTLPSHLIPNEEDTETERNKKRRAAKSLKDQWRHQRKEIESENRQKSWQSFQKKTVGKRVVDDGTGSIFATQEGVNDRVGVVSKKQKTEFGGKEKAHITM